MKWIATVALALGACVQDSGGSRMMTGGSGGGGAGGGVGGGDGGTGGFGGDAGGGGTGGMLMDIRSRQTVTFDITNGAAADRYVVTSGHYCDDYALSFQGTEVPRTLGFQCLCECPNPGMSFAMGYHQIAPGASYRTTWDARVLMTYSDPYDCAAHGWPGLPPTTELVGIHQPVGAGMYSVTFGVERSLPDNCQNQGSGDFLCTGPSGMVLPIQQICTASVQPFAFTLPPMGDITVPITLQ